MSIHQKLLEIQEEIHGIKKTEENPYFKSKYFDINKLLDIVKPALNKRKILLLQPLTHEGSYLLLQTELRDTESDEVVSSTTILPDGGDAQKQGSAITYFRRYAIQSLLALNAEDDDANAASVEVPAYVREGATVSRVATNASAVDPNIPHCSHGPMKLNTTKKAGANFGRQFYSCPQPMGKQCADSFVWADEWAKPKAPIIDEDGDEVVNKELAGL